MTPYQVEPIWSGWRAAALSVREDPHPRNPGQGLPSQSCWLSMCASSKATLWVKAQHEGALPPPCIVRKDPRVPHTARRGA